MIGGAHWRKKKKHSRLNQCPKCLFHFCFVLRNKTMESIRWKQFFWSLRPRPFWFADKWIAIHGLESGGETLTQRFIGVADGEKSGLGDLRRDDLNEKNGPVPLISLFTLPITHQTSSVDQVSEIWNTSTRLGVSGCISLIQTGRTSGISLKWCHTAGSVARLVTR